MEKNDLEYFGSQCTVHKEFLCELQTVLLFIKTPGGINFLRLGSFHI